uniref:Col_cuticle_N domain-containing protein n=1 Tax=Steinernema glaseri TaxID=37863 RepID=A0A1I7ZHZ0_9BILA
MDNSTEIYLKHTSFEGLTAKDFDAPTPICIVVSFSFIVIIVAYLLYSFCTDVVVKVIVRKIKFNRLRKELMDNLANQQQQGEKGLYQLQCILIWMSV